ncbi:kappa-casein [Pteropus medius]|uniref:Kappa-casein n=1 Tax=Pteropus vampyrus TaxID=132908 RepID=A0A6P3Q6F9_PTEVA|nr:kappa-casein [Pteropus vampyrus]XP_039701309.1 kappa-casein [Pteropus giganteus]
MMRFFLVVNILALTLPFLGAEVQNQERPTGCENNERSFNQNAVKSIPIHYALNNYLHAEPNYYQYRLASLINNQYMSYPYYAKSVTVRPHAQISQWQVLPNIYSSIVARHQYLHPSLIAVPSKKIQDKTVIPSINTIATVKPTLIPTPEPTVSSVVIPEASSEFVVSTPETTTVTITSSTV